MKRMEGGLTPREIDAIHTIDDLCKANAKLRRANEEVRLLLADLPHALEHGAYDVCAEYIDRALLALAKVKEEGS